MGAVNPRTGNPEGGKYSGKRWSEKPSGRNGGARQRVGRSSPTSHPQSSLDATPRARAENKASDERASRVGREKPVKYALKRDTYHQPVQGKGGSSMQKRMWLTGERRRSRAGGNLRRQEKFAIMQGECNKPPAGREGQGAILLRAEWT